MLKNPYVKNILSAVAIAFFGYLLLTLTFLIDFLFQSLIASFVRLFTPTDFNMAYWFAPLKHILFMVVVLIISWFVIKSKLGDIYKAAYLVVPSAVIFATIGLFLFRWPVLVYGLCALVFGVIIFYLYKTKKPWLYYYSVILVASSMLIFTLLGGEI